MEADLAQFIYTLRPNRVKMLTDGPTPQEASILVAHVEYLERLSNDDVVLLAGRTQTTNEATFGIVVLQADSESTARNIMDNDPAILRGVMDGRLFPYQIAVVSPNILTADANNT